VNSYDVAFCFPYKIFSPFLRERMISWLHVAAFGLVVLPGYSAATACRPQLLQVNLAKEVASELRSSRRRYGCDFDGVECIATGGDGGEGVKCSLPAATQATSPRCVPSILQQSLERDIRSELRSAQRKYGCGPASSVRCEKDDPSRPDWVRCHVILLSDKAEDGESSKTTKKATPAGARVGAECDLTVLTDTLSHELFQAMQKAQRRYDCPWIESAHCVSDPQGWIDCNLRANTAKGVAISSTCDMAAFTKAVSSEFGEELADAESKYDCPIPPQLTCTTVNAGAENMYSCTIESASDSSYRSGSSNGSSSSSDEEAEGGPRKEKWSFRYFRGKRTL
jgi:hypothetical protein